MANVWVCQRCAVPVQLDATLARLTDAKEVLESAKAGSIGRARSRASRSNGGGGGGSRSASRERPAAVRKSKSRSGSNRSRGSARKTPNAPQTPDAEPDAATLVTETPNLRKVLDQLSAASGVPLPLCDQCTEEELAEASRELDELSLEQATLAQALTDKSDATVDVTGQALQSRDAYTQAQKRAEKEEKSLRERLSKIESERDALAREMTLLRAEAADLATFDERYWQDFNDFAMRLQLYEEERDALRTKIDSAVAQIQRLKKTNVFNDAFHIWHDGHFGSINGFRLGRLTSQQVDWSEINAAWGQALLLTELLAKQLDLTFKGKELKPMGSFSKILHNGTAYELYGSKEFSLNKLMWYRRFDQAMVLFLECVSELNDYIVKRDAAFAMPYGIDADKVDGNSIRYSNNSEEVWSRALKFALTDLKAILGWVARTSTRT